MLSMRKLASTARCETMHRLGCAAAIVKIAASAVEHVASPLMPLGPAPAALPGKIAKFRTRFVQASEANIAETSIIFQNK